MPSLTKEQLTAASLIADGETQIVAAECVQVATKTVNRWMKLPEMRAEVDRLVAERKKLIQEEIRKDDREFVSEFLAAQKEYRDARLGIYKTKLSRALRALQKTDARFTDIPAEAIPVHALPQFYKAFDDMAENAMAGWAEIIGIDELLRRLDQDSDQK